jgi:hypothetical protein
MLSWGRRVGEIVRVFMGPGMDGIGSRVGWLVRDGVGFWNGMVL